MDRVSVARVRRRGELEHVSKVVPRTDSGILYAQYMEALRDKERTMGRPLLSSELDRFAREYHAPEYGAEVPQVDGAWGRGVRRKRVADKVSAARGKSSRDRRPSP